MGGRARPWWPTGLRNARRVPEGRSIAAPARERRASCGAIRTAVAALTSGHTAIDGGGAPARELPVADFLRAAELEPAERAALDQGVPVRRGHGYTLRVTAVPAVHQLLARREGEDRVSTLTS
ncbi:hypothetical protein AB0G85_32105 [Streptomyces sioyaensis]|uniref:hypothetical protein n=1 Tax=Streptomyces sioyaensis TaxID=67364 RepID=UPI003405D2A8